jgi:hypothetical protein
LIACLNQDKHSHAFPTGLEADTWSTEYLTDLTSIRDQNKDKDLLSGWIDQHLVPWYHHKISYKRHEAVAVPEAWGGEGSGPLRVHHYSESVVTSAVTAIGTILSSLLPAISMLALDWIDAPVSRMCAIVVLTFMFSIVFMLVTKGKRAECFAATATFSAILVVFVGNADGSGYACRRV